MPMQLSDYLLLLPIGLVAGASGGLLGIGGSLVMIPALVILFGPQDQHLYQAAAMIVNVFIVAPSVVQHLRVRATLRPVTRWMIPSAVVAAMAGVWLSERGVFRGAGQGYLQIIFGVFLLYVLAYNLWRLRTRTRLAKLSEADAAQLSKVRVVALVGLPTGLLGGLLGIGGGLVAVPTQQVFLRIPLPNAIANSAGTILWSGLAGAIYKNAALGSHGYSLGQAILIAACLIPTAMVSASFFAARVHRWRVGVIRAAFVVLLAYAAFELLRVGWGQVSRATARNAQQNPSLLVSG